MAPVLFGETIFEIVLVRTIFWGPQIYVDEINFPGSSGPLGDLKFRAPLSQTTKMLVLGVNFYIAAAQRD